MVRLKRAASVLLPVSCLLALATRPAASDVYVDLGRFGGAGERPRPVEWPQRHGRK